MFTFKNIFGLLCAITVLGISVLLPATASAESNPPLGDAICSPSHCVSLATVTASATNCPSGKCYEEEAEWVEGITVTASGGSASGGVSSIIRETPVSKLEKIYLKKFRVKVGYYQNPEGFQGSSKSCTDPEKHTRWNFHAGDYYKTTNHLREPMPSAKWHKGDKICNWHIVKKGKHYWVVGTQFLCANVKSELPIHFHLKKPKVVYEQFPTVEKFYEVAIKRLEIKAEGGSGEGGSATVKTPGHYQCKPGGELNGKMCKYCPPPSCEEKEPPCCEPPPPPCIKISNESEIEELYPDEVFREFHIHVEAPQGDKVAIFFEVSEHGGWFDPYELKFPFFSGAGTFKSEYHAPSHPGLYRAWVKVVDYSRNETEVSEGQTVRVLEPEEKP